MGLTKIEWTGTPLADGTVAPGFSFNPWHGCTKVSSGCKFCYADAQDRRFGESHWGPAAPRKMMGEAYWRQPLRWNADAAAAGIRSKVFCASMADVFEQLPFEHRSYQAMSEARCRLWTLIKETPHLDWLLLTKRPENAFNLTPATWEKGWPANVWLGTSVEDQATADTRIPALLQMPAAVRFVSYEPALGPVDFTRIALRTVPAPAWETQKKETWIDALAGAFYAADSHAEACEECPSLDLIIVGGESGMGARPFDLAWAYDVLRQVRLSNIVSPTAVFVKQLGARPVQGNKVLLLRHRKGADMQEWPQGLAVREFPTVELYDQKVKEAVNAV